ncbi:putative Holliday junction resolvase [Pseudarthrobacter sp. W1I19]|uniref:Holliday junction resolvase RuvX n=1 Tax=Pseudarthrobacter sp. W1I19 TaxID=3042288 RepID=UPI00277E4896|nr:Holliday junction resolvase RuvX [Pseudarthrobacter sp. W1I19]MDQ0923248.1 putative Holliday junction resolvase [Pseudarthrobacter sp. W1I19]
MTNPTAAGESPQGVKLGIDVGTVRVGVAICDRDSILATPYKTLDRNPKKNSDIRVIANLVQELGAVQVIVGLPRTMKGEEHASARMATEYAGLLAAELAARDLAVPVNLVDERLSSVTAHRNLHEAGMGSRDHRKVVDQVAAAGILQHAIDMQKARGADVGRRVTAPSPSVDPGVNEADESVRIAPEATDRTSDNGRQQ